MCKNCVKKQYPQRGRLCSESGAYIVNLDSCISCQESNADSQGSKNRILNVRGRQAIKINEDELNEDDSQDKEVIQFEHVCTLCNHVVAKHLHEFWIEDGYQEYRMECLLCGLGQDSISVMPRDPRKASAHV